MRGGEPRGLMRFEGRGEGCCAKREEEKRKDV